MGPYSFSDSSLNFDVVLYPMRTSIYATGTWCAAAEETSCILPAREGSDRRRLDAGVTPLWLAHKLGPPRAESRSPSWLDEYSGPTRLSWSGIVWTRAGEGRTIAYPFICTHTIADRGRMRSATKDQVVRLIGRPERMGRNSERPKVLWC